MKKLIRGLTKYICHVDSPGHFKPKFVMLVGAPGSGKTTYAENLFGYARIGVDNCHSKSELKRRAFGLAGKISRVVMDGTFRFKNERQFYLTMAKNEGYETKIIYFDVPYKVCLERLMNRAHHPTLDNSDEKKVKQALGDFFKRFEEIEDGEADEIKIIK